MGPQPHLDVPSSYLDGFAAAVTAGMADAATFGTRNLGELSVFAQQQLGPPPGADVQKGELVELHKIADARTQQQTDASSWFAKHGHRDMWQPYMKDYEQRVGKDQATAGYALLERASNLTEQATSDAKQRYARMRPFNVDPTLKVPISRPDNDSYPSGHSSLAFSAALVLSSLMPDRKAELMNAAAQVGYSRLVGSVHFPSDVMAGARIAALATGVVLARK
ncbi:MAG: phosphatase PAP2 family protein [Thermoleophilia bacterium]|nr:phosphatase PAP2 family protein [Thermoleophilia bacterium]